MYVHSMQCIVILSQMIGLLVARITGVILITGRERRVHTINAIWLSVTVFLHDESRESESVPSIFVFRVLGL